MPCRHACGLASHGKVEALSAILTRKDVALRQLQPRRSMVECSPIFRTRSLLVACCARRARHNELDARRCVGITQRTLARGTFFAVVLL